MDEGDNTNWTRERVVSAGAMAALLTAVLVATWALNQ